MVELQDKDKVTYVVQEPYDSGAGAAAMVIISLVLVAIVGYIVYAFNMNPSHTIIERDTNTTVQVPVAAPVAAPQAPSTPAPMQAASAPVQTAPAPAAPQSSPAMPAPSSDNASTPSSDQ